jgi:hypothetical protein
MVQWFKKTEPKTFKIRRNQAMKKLSLLFIAGLISLTALAKESIPEYVITADGIKYYDNVRYGLVDLVGVNNQGKVRYKMDEVLAYRKDGRIYEKVPMMVNNRKTERHVFMELVAYRNGLKVYKHRSGDLDNNYEFFVYRNQEFVVQFDQRNTPSLKAFFFRPYGILATSN